MGATATALARGNCFFASVRRINPAMSVAITQLRLVAFRSHSKLTLDVGHGPIAFAGPNGAGKTNILEAISLFSPGRGLRRAAPQDLARQPDTIGWSAKLTLDTPDGETELWTGADATGKRTAKRDGKAVSVVSLGSVLRIIWLTPALDRVFVEGPGERRRFLDRMTLSFFPDHAEAAMTYERAMRDRNRLMKEGRDDPRWLDALEHQMSESGARMALNRKNALAALLAAQHGQSDFPTAKADIVGDDWTAESLSESLFLNRRLDSTAGRTLKGPHRDDLAVTYEEKNVPAAACSTGEQKGLLVSLMLANAMALKRASGHAPILLLDEISAHFDTERRASLFQAIDNIGAQSWMTGTEWGLFSGLKNDAIHFSVGTGAMGSIVKGR